MFRAPRVDYGRGGERWGEFLSQQDRGSLLSLLLNGRARARVSAYAHASVPISNGDTDLGSYIP